MDRRLFPDDGYYLGNGIALCDKHQKRAQATIITVEELRLKAAVKSLILPPLFRADTVYDRWGNIIVNPEMLILGPLKHEEAMNRALGAAKKQRTIYEAMPFMIDEIKELALNTPAKMATLEFENYSRRVEAE